MVDHTDHGKKPYVLDIEKETEDNDLFRVTKWTGKHLQMTLMSIPVGSSIGLEAHPETDQFIRLDAGKGHVIMGPAEDDLSFQLDVEDGWSVQVPAGTWHDIINTGDEDMRLYVVYAPTHHTAGIVQKTSEDAEADEESGRDVPPKWSVQPAESEPDKKA